MSDPGNPWSHVSAADLDTCIVCGEVGPIAAMHVLTASDCDQYGGTPGDLVCDDCLEVDA